jgi:cardiolipin synthase
VGFSREDIENIYGSPFIDGNSVELLKKGGESFRRIFETLRDARESVLLQFYIYRNDETGAELAELLKEKAREGVKVFLLYDHLGSFGTPRRFWRGLKEAGIRVGASHPFRWHSPGRYTYRDHRKILIIDGHTAFTGGLNIANEYLGLGLRRKKPWRDTAIIMKGPAATALMEEFRTAWEALGEGGLPPLPPPPPEQGRFAAIPIFAHSGRGRRRMRRLLYYSINHSSTDICLTTAYFTPSSRMLYTLEQAVKRGVRVRLLVPGKSDVAPAHYAGRAFFSRLLEAGVEIYSYNGPMMHAKTYIFDRIWSVVGSANLDFRSMRWNDEGNVGIIGEEFAEQMVAMFHEDLDNSIKIKEETWSQRPFCEKLKERLFSLMRKRL